jgi:DNA-binding response OmpR family regulator
MTTSPAKHVLIVEDEDSIRQTLRYNLSQEGFVISEASTGTEALSAARRQRPDLILLDLMLPELSGLEVCRILRQEMTVPIIMLTAKGSELDKVVGLHVGADDYVTKPFSLNELLARVSAMLRRAEMTVKERVAGREIEEMDNFRIDRGARTVHVDGEELHLAPKKFYGDHKTVDVHVRWLREKFERFDRLPFRITTVFGVGYRIDRLDQAAG